ncbi:19970_t:CDS:2, partial [Racocetra fulgida]
IRSSIPILCSVEGVIRNIEPVGRYFLAHARRKLNNHSFSEDERIQAEANAKQLEVIQDEDFEEETPELLSRDPKDWKVDDPRIQKFKQEEKAAKEAKKKEKEDAIKNAKEAAQRAAEEERLKKEQAEAEAKLKTHNYFYPPDESPPLDVIDMQLSELDFLFEKLSLEDLQNVRKQLDSTQDRHGAKQILVKEASGLVSSGVLSADSFKYFKSDKLSTSLTTAPAPAANGPAATTNVWAAAQQAQLERALQAYPPSWKGEGDRWDKIAEAVENKTKKECKLRVK